MSFEVVQICNPRIHEAEEKRIKSFVLIPLGSSDPCSERLQFAVDISQWRDARLVKGIRTRHRVPGSKQVI